jgi:hypothetical protein
MSAGIENKIVQRVVRTGPEPTVGSAGPYETLTVCLDHSGACSRAVSGWLKCDVTRLLGIEVGLAGDSGASVKHVE